MKTTILILGILVIAFLTVGGVWLYAQQEPHPAVSLPPTRALVEAGTSTIAQVGVSNTSTPPTPNAATGTPTIGAVSATPSLVTLNMPTPVIVTAQITDPSLIPGSVNLLLLGVTGTQPTILGVMQGAGSGIYSLQQTFDETSNGQIQLQVSAAFRGMLKRLIANVPPIQITKPQELSRPDFGLTMNFPADWSNVTQTPDFLILHNIDPDSTSTASFSFFQVRYMPGANPSSLPIDQWFANFARQLPSSPGVASSTNVSGHPAVQIEYGPIILKYIDYVSRGTDIFEISYTASDSFSGEYQAMLNSLRF